MSKFLDLLAPAIVADAMPPLSINRVLYKRLSMLSASKRPAFEAAGAYLGKRVSPPWISVSLSLPG
ncbi:hypothetical protein NNO_0052 [Hydrogenimonas sp.]|nr:hypothetical protein NNO_0052 [Hydrogenimonas sp.]